MPNRILRDYTLSEKINEVSCMAECLFIRLIMKADDFGAFHANPRILKSQCFALKAEITEAEISLWMQELVDKELIFIYTATRKQYLKIIDFNQRLRSMKNKFPDPETDDNIDSSATRGESRPETEEKRNETEKEVIKKLGSQVDQFLLDLPNSSYLTDISIRINVPLATLQAAIPDFKKGCNTSYKNMSEFSTHFKNWYLKRQSAAPIKDPNKIDMTFGRKHFRK